jgi:protein O-GlcNAc transferase
MSTNPLNQLADALKTLSTQPQNAQLWCRVGFLYSTIFEPQEALDTFRCAQHINPKLSDAHYGEALALQQLGNTALALPALERAMALNTNDQRLFSAYAYLCSAEGRHPEQTFLAYRHWAQRFAEPLRPAHRPAANRRSGSDKLRVGYISADFRQHAVMDFFAPVLAHHNRQQFSIIAFSNGEPDALTPSIRQQFDYWNDIRGLTDQATADLITKRGIDILVDLSGHTNGTRLLSLARQPAAVQFTWFGYNGTTGMSAIDGIHGSTRKRELLDRAPFSLANLRVF